MARAKWRRPTRLEAHGLITAATFISYILGQMLTDGALATLFAVGGVSACGWSWLLTRALFNAAEHDALWPRVVVAIVWISGALALLAQPATGFLAQAVENIYVLSGSAALLLTFTEPLHGFNRTLPLVERRFRIAYLVVYTLLVAASVLLLREGETGMDAAHVKSLCAAVGLSGGAAAFWFRLRSPLPAPNTEVARRDPTPEDRRLAARIDETLRRNDLFVAPELRLADLAQTLGEPEYKVSQSIAAASGFPNFNRLINFHRIDRAKTMLADPSLRQKSILLIAFECGFASIGPFNRAFKEETGVTPSAYRRTATPG